MFDADRENLLPFWSDAPDRQVLWDDRTRIWLTERELRAQCMAVARQLERPGKGLVFLLSSNRAEALVAFLAAVTAGHAVALIDPGLAVDRIDNLCAPYSPDFVLGCGEVEWLREAANRPGEWDIAEGEQSGLVVASRRTPVSAPAISPDLQVLLLTSGTTGNAKFVRLSARAIAANAKQIALSLSLGTSSVAIAHLPLHYSYGLSVVTSHLAAGARIALMDDAITSESFWQKVAASGGTHFPGVPFHYAVLARLGFGVVPVSVDTLTQAGGHLGTDLQKSILQKAEERGARMFVMYGQTEASPRIATVPPARLREKLGSVGLALPDGRLQIVDEDGAPLASGKTGAVVYQGPNVMMGYAENREHLALGDVMGGRLETGDLGWMDREGYLFLSGRTARFAKIAGLRISLDDIEREVSELGAVACIERGERVIVMFEGDVPADAKARLKTIALSAKIPSSSFAVGSLAQMPRKSNGKIDYGRVKEIANV